jgi:hypothetical protein
MKTLKSIFPPLLIMTAAIVGARGEQFRTDINPAQLYYQAFIVSPDLGQADRDFFNTNAWRGRQLPERFGELIARYDDQLRLVRQAAHSTVPCDWGIDFSLGPATWIPHLPRSKQVAQKARLRAMWDLQQARPAEACDDLLAVFALARNTSRDGTVISVLVQFAIENIALFTVAENFHQFSPEALKQLVDGLETAPARGTVAACMPTEKSCLQDWMLRKIAELRKANPGNDAKVMQGIREAIPSFENQGQIETDVWERLDKASGGTSDGVINLLHERERVYQRLTKIMVLPHSDYEDQIKQFTVEIQKSPNPFVSQTFPALEKSRQKEFANIVALAMVRAAVEYKLHGEPGLKSVTDPCGKGPFAFQRFVFEGVDRGFKLTSAYDGRGSPEVLIFVEKDGPPFKVYWKFAGQALLKSSVQE